MSGWYSYDLERASIRSSDDEKEDRGKKRRWRRESTWSVKRLRRSLHNDPRSVLLAFLNHTRLILKLSKAILACIVGLIIFNTSFRKPHQDVLQFIDPLIGSSRGGHVFAGATLPFGMAKPVADVSGKENMGGFAWDESQVTGFSSLHDSGSGAFSSMGNFPIFLQPSCSNVSICPMSKESRPQTYLPWSVDASPGYFALTLESGIHAEMTASERASLFRFSFVSNTITEDPVLLMDASDLHDSVGPRSLKVDPEKSRMTAEGRFKPSWGQGTYLSYQCVDFRGAKLQDYGIFNDATVVPGLMSTGESVNQFQAPRQGVYVRFKNVQDKDQIYVRVGLSWLSIERACQNAERDIPDFNMDRLLKRARKAWSDKMKPISIASKGVDRKHLRNFWSGAYRAFQSPQDYTGENQLWSSSEPYYDSWYCIWDTFRGVHPFYVLIDPVSQSRMVRSLLDIFKHTGWLPDCRMSFCKGYTQGGSNADVIIVDSYMKNVAGIDWIEAYAALITDAEVQPPNWNIEGRGGLKSWKEKGYIPYRDDDEGGLQTRSVSRTVEYAYNDFCIAQMANVTGRTVDFAKYAKRASNWRNIYDPEHESMGFKGFLQPRWANGTFEYQNATLCSPLNNFEACYLNRDGHETYEGSPWLYSFYVPGDMQGLIDLVGGSEAFLERLDKLHDSGVLYMGDEQAFLTTFLYHYAGRPGLSGKRTHQYIPSMFNDTIEGIPGNDDSGAMGTFVLFSMLGVFPSAGQNVYFIIPPFFPSVSITNPQTGKTALIKSINFEPMGKNMYIQSAKLNGRPYSRNWIDHNFFLRGGTLELMLGETESSWGTRQSDVPPSLSTGLYFG